MTDPANNALNLLGWQTSIQHLRGLVQQSVQTGWQMGNGAWSALDANDPQSWQNSPLATVNAKDHLAWALGRKSCWLGQLIHVSAQSEYDLTGLGLRLSLIWWAEVAAVYVNGELVQAGDLFDHSARVLLTPTAQAGDCFWVTLHLISPGHDPGALVKSNLIFESATGVDPGFVADELEIVSLFASELEPDCVLEINSHLQQLDHCQTRVEYDQQLNHLHQRLAAVGQPIRNHQINLTGHAHLDLAWLWPIAETWDVAERTFQSVLNLQTQYPELIFSHSSPALYEWIETHRPELFVKIQAKIQAQQWEVAAGMWVEPELNLISGESIARQILYGQAYVKEKFGNISRVAWLPDSFGFCQQLPQLLKQGGIDYFVTQKLRWNDTTEFPDEWFWWQALDGSQVLSYCSAPIGEGIEPVKMSRYAQAWSQKTNLKQSLWLPGVGDHGGGPTRDMLEIYRRWQRLGGVSPQLKFSAVVDYLDQLKASSDLTELPIWSEELYLEFHRGCYTSHSDQKQANRHAEIQLYQAELWSALATLISNINYPQAELERLWKGMLLNQFHDILPGSAIPAVYQEANQAWDDVLKTTTQLLDTAQNHILGQIYLPDPPVPGAYGIVIFNSLNWPRSEVVRLELGELGTQAWTIQDTAGYPIRCHQAETVITFWLWDVPSVGYKVVWLCPQASFSPPANPPLGFVLENGFLQAEINPQTGEINNLYDKLNQRAVFNAPGNQLQLFRDQGQYWDAWNIDPHYHEHPLIKPELKEIKWQAWNDIEQRIRVRWQWRNSTIQQDYCLVVNTPILHIETQLNWQDHHVLLKAAFPLAFRADVAHYETPAGVTQRPTLPNPENPTLTPPDQAKWEVPALQWADLSEPSHQYGVSLINNSKQGYDAQPQQLRLTLLRAPTWPDPQADLGNHQFSYGLYPHYNNWIGAKTWQKAAEFNQPLVAKIIPPHPEITLQHPLPTQASLLDLGSETLILMALKQTQDQSGWILRCLETTGQATELNLQSDLELFPADLRRVNLLEVPDAETHNNPVQQVGGWEISSWRFSK
ncbi:alpha-mannosidase [Thermosynechococcaceae cyanobacterium BACA0444]|uniref:Alpha-mannosidase n=1 Tax=Pseudocalidococcus azoricus BACA0444 TaxID=2918990 RepID=A0AAE4FTL0_9CYAN|nr:alpha-mannosidase [Pseudocalidococcus azoricus]MDS3862010.1 alpha-mannosidase [Pseudocalidococcus azoricus BACA0444]